MIYYDINDIYIYIYIYTICVHIIIYTHETGDDLELLWILANWWTNRTSRGHWKWWWITSLVGCYSHAWLLFSATGKMIWIWKHTDTTMHNQQSLELETLQQCSPVRFTKKETLSILSIHSCSRAKAQFKPFWCKNLRWHLTILLAAWGSMDTYQIVRFVVWFPFSPKQLDDFIMFGLCGGDEQSINSLNSISVFAGYLSDEASIDWKTFCQILGSFQCSYLFFCYLVANCFGVLQLKPWTIIIKPQFGTPFWCVITYRSNSTV